jgi:quercetin dioxygenase-like cupin family protein
MQTKMGRSRTRRQFVCACCGGAVVAWVPKLAFGAEQFVPVLQEPRHHKRLENEYLRVLEVIIDPGDATLFHEHTLDIAVVPVQGTEAKNEVMDKPEAAINKVPLGKMLFAKYQGGSYVHRVTNLGSEPFSVMAFEVIVPAPGKFGASDRSGNSVYVSEVDNDRVRGWRVKLEPGKSAAPISQTGPGLRVMLSGNQLTETVNGAEHAHEVKRGGFDWLPPGMTRALRNTGTEPLELVEWEVK